MRIAILVAILSLLAMPAFAGITVYATGPSEMPLPENLKAADVEAVSIGGTGRSIPVDFQAKDQALLITPCRDLEGGTVCTIKLFTNAGKRFLVKANVAEFPEFIPNKESVVRVPAKPSKGFNYDYLVYVPNNFDKSGTHKLLVQGNNNPGVLRIPGYTEVSARSYILQWGNTVSTGLQAPFLMPIFPREEDYHSPDYAYIQFLDRGTLTAKGKRERADLQLVAMISDARRLLDSIGIRTDEKIFIIGFSSDGKFAQRFTVLHPEIVAAAFAGGIAGITTLPMSEYQGETLNFPLGVADLKELTGQEFNKDEYQSVPQLFCMGGAETTDATEYGDCYPKADSEQIWRLFGRKVMPDRWKCTQKILKECAPNIQCTTFPGIGHDVNKDVTDTIVKFFKDHSTR